jgi:hypothetical protein
MPKVGKMKFPYTTAGKKAAKQARAAAPKKRAKKKA